MFKRTLEIFLGVALMMQMAGCFYVGDDHRWHHDRDREFAHPEHHDDHDPGIDVHVHG
jgi:hypothetical protein